MPADPSLPVRVELVAGWEGGEMHEVSRFEQRAGRWVYVDGVVDRSSGTGSS